MSALSVLEQLGTVIIALYIFVSLQIPRAIQELIISVQMYLLLLHIICGSRQTMRVFYHTCHK